MFIIWRDCIYRVPVFRKGVRILIVAKACHGISSAMCQLAKLVCLYRELQCRANLWLWNHMGVFVTLAIGGLIGGTIAALSFVWYLTGLN